MKNLATHSFTLIELLLYFTVLGIFLFAALSFAIQILNVSQLTQNRHELQTNAEFITGMIETSIRSAQAVNVEASIFDSDQGVLALTMGTDDLDHSDDLNNLEDSDDSRGPEDFLVIFSYSNGDILMQEDSNPSIALNSSFVQVDRLRFHRIEFPKSPEQIVLDIELSTPSELPNTEASLSLHFSTSLRL